MGAIEKLKILIEQRGLKLSDIEKELDFPVNNLSAALKGKRKISDKWEFKIEAWISNLENPISFPYLTKERDCQLILMKGLGIPTDSGATFEQLVNTVIFMAGEYKGKAEKQKKFTNESTNPIGGVKVVNLTTEQPQTNFTIDTQAKIKEYEDQIKSLENVGVKSVLAQKTIRFCQNKIYELKHPKP